MQLPATAVGPLVFHHSLTSTRVPQVPSSSRPPVPSEGPRGFGASAHLVQNLLRWTGGALCLSKPKRATGLQSGVAASRAGAWFSATPAIAPFSSNRNLSGCNQIVTLPV